MSHSTSDLKCSHCKHRLTTPLFCFSCNTLQQVNLAQQNYFHDYFHVLGIQAEYSIDLTELAENYEQLTSELHPDFYANATENERRQSELSSSLLNRAYQTLKKSLRTCSLFTSFAYRKAFFE